VRVRDRAVALDVSDDSAGGVPNLDAPPVAGVVNVPEAVGSKNSNLLNDPDFMTEMLAN